MSETVAQHLEGKQGRTLAKLTENKDLANVLMGFLGRMIVMAAQKGKPLQGIRIDAPTMNGNQITARITFSTIHASGSFTSFMSRNGDFMEYTRTKSANLALAMEKNPEFLQLFERILTLCENLCNDKGWPFSFLRIYKAFVDREDVMVLWLKGGA